MEIIKNEKDLATASSGHVEDSAVLTANVNDVLVQERLSAWSLIAFRLYGVIAITTLNCTMNGFDGTLMSSLNAMKPFHNQFGTKMDGGGTGILFAIYAVGNLVGAVAAAPASDILGRRFGMCIGSFFVILGAVLEATASNVGQFMGGRFLIGFGVSISNTAGPTYLVEVVLPQWRGALGGLYNVVGYYSGALACTWIAYGTGFLSTNWSWRIPVLVQIVPAAIILITAYMLPESPRWLWSKNKKDEARAVLIKYHGAGDPDSALVAFECVEIEEQLRQDIESGNNIWWDFRALFIGKAMWYRLWIIFLVCVFSQFVGGSVISYYMPVMLQNAGITDSHQQLLLNALNIVFGFVSGIVGSFFVERFGRRSLFLWGTFLTGLVYIPINVIASFNADHITQSMGYGFIACIFLYGIIYSFCWTTLQALYPAEILPTRVRAKGLAFQGLVSGGASFINMYATPVGMSTIGWKMYTIFLVFHFMEYLAMFFTLPETKGRTLEEIEEVFEAGNVVKASLRK
ncbi:hypothetical protein N7527_001466 [Penicillium freii]|nr:hypothetical protein N7527_001466 [Penicillium freii]